MLIPGLFFVQDDEQLLIQSPTRRYCLTIPRIGLAWCLQKIIRERGFLPGPGEYARVKTRLSHELKQQSRQRELPKLPAGHSDIAAAGEGRADALSMQAFFEHLPNALSRSEQLDIYRVLRKQAILDALSQSQARLSFRPSDVNLSGECCPSTALLSAVVGVKMPGQLLQELL